jgi:DGQHR domain-containing protein
LSTDQSAWTPPRAAVCVPQISGTPLYLFALTAREIAELADISRIGRDKEGKLIGYQRGEVRRHVKEIAQYLNQDQPLFPNTLVLAFVPGSVEFKKKRGKDPSDGLLITGTMQIRLARSGQQRPAWIVDGQQRAMALREARNQNFLVPVSAFIAKTVAEQREQFIRVNNAKPLARRLIDELLPQVNSPLEPRLAARQVPSALVDALNVDDKSPFKGLIRRSSTGAEQAQTAVVVDSALTDVIQKSMKDGCLALHRDLAGDYDSEQVWNVLIAFWTAVRDTFPEAWGKPPAKSRLMHGVGIRAMGRLMDKVMMAIPVSTTASPPALRAGLERIAPLCAWTSGRWVGLDLDWNQVESTPKQLNALSLHLAKLYFVAPGQ